VFVCPLIFILFDFVAQTLGLRVWKVVEVGLESKQIVIVVDLLAFDVAVVGCC
jgi:hypothetical protein